MVTVGVDPEDKRGQRVTLTPLGEARLANSLVLWRQAQERFERAFGMEPAAALRAALATIASPGFAGAFARNGEGEE
jgi:DNA-binding MarR family transcriptional regulator